MPLDFSLSSDIPNQCFSPNIISLETLDATAYNLQIEINGVLSALSPELGLLPSHEILECIDDELLFLKMKQFLTSERIVYKLMWLLHFSTMLKRTLVLTNNNQADFLWEVLGLLSELERLDRAPWSPRSFLGEDISDGVYKLLIPIQETLHLLPIHQYKEIHVVLCKKVNALRSITEGFLTSLISGDKKTMLNDEVQELYWIGALTATLHPFPANQPLLIESIGFLLDRALRLELWNLADLLSQSLRLLEEVR